MDRYVDLVARTSFRILCDRSDSELVTRQVFDSLVRKGSESFDGTTPARWYLARTVRLCRKRFWHNSLTGIWGNRTTLYVQAAPKVDDVDDYITTQAWEIYCRASDGLTINQRVVYVLREIEGLSEDEVMEVAGLWRSTVRLALEIARENIRYELSKFGKVAEYDAYVGFLRRVHYICGSETEIQ